MKQLLTLLLLLLSLSAYSQGPTFVRKPSKTTIPQNQTVPFAIPPAPLAKQKPASTHRHRTDKNTNTAQKTYKHVCAYPEGYYELSGTFSKTNYSAPVAIKFYSDGNRLSGCEYYNLVADDGACSMDIKENANGALFLSGYDNEGTYFTITLSKIGTTYKGIARIGTVKLEVNLSEE